MLFRSAELLLANGADPRAVSEDGTTAVKQAQRQGLDAVADLLAISVSARHKRER